MLTTAGRPGLSANPAIAIDARGAIYIAWDDASRGDSRPDIFFLVSREGGKGFDKSVNVSQTEGISSNPEIFAEGDGQVAIAWFDMGKTAKTPDIWFARSVDGGRTFSTAKDLTNTPGLCSSPDVVIVRDHAFVVWEEVEKFKSHVRTTSTSMK